MTDNGLQTSPTDARSTAHVYKSLRSLDVSVKAVSQKALLIVRPTRCVSALQAELPTNVPTLVEF